MRNKITFFQRLKSYFLPQHLASTSSRYNAVLEVLLVDAKVQLTTQNVCYSYEDRYNSFAIAFHKIELHRFSFQKVLVLGGGLCSIPQILQKYNAHAQFDVVEIDAVVIDLAQKFAPAKVLQHCTFFCADAFEFMKVNNQHYDLICIDIFEDDKVPLQFCQSNFLKNIAQACTPSTKILFSSLKPAQNTENQQIKTLQLAFYEVFLNATCFETTHNLIFYKP